MSGFIATITVIVLAFSVMAMIVVVTGAANSYADSIYLHELRSYARDDLSSCLSKAEDTLARNFFWHGVTKFDDFNCEVIVDNKKDLVILTATVRLDRVIMRASEDVSLEDFYIKVVKREVED